MTHHRIVVCTLVAILALGPLPNTEASDEKTRIAIVSSYHREYLWSQETNTGVIIAMLEFGYLDNDQQGVKYTRDDYVESSRAVIKKLWMDTKRKNSREQIDTP